jgi:predicted TIM-barrel fold metal-dependent hydrolase
VQVKPGFIDAHIHVWPESGERAKPSRYTPADHYGNAEPAGVTRTVLIQPGMFGVDNSYMLEAVRSYPGVFSAVAVVDADAAELETTVARLRSQGARGFRIAARKDKPWKDWEGMQRLWSIAGARGMAMCPLINPDAFTWVAALCERHSETTVVIDHLGRVGASGTVLDSEVRALCGLARFPRVHVKVSAFYALGRKSAPYTDLVPLIRQVFETFGPRRLMWGSDAPYQAQPPHDYAASVKLVREQLRFAGAEDREWLLGKTAERVFFSL